MHRQTDFSDRDRHQNWSRENTKETDCRNIFKNQSRMEVVYHENYDQGNPSQLLVPNECAEIIGIIMYR